MNHLRKFKENVDNYYWETSFIEYYKGDPIGFSYYDVKVIKDICNKKNINVEINYERIIINPNSYRSGVLYRIEDDYYQLSVSKYWYKADQIEGLINMLEDLF